MEGRFFSKPDAQQQERVPPKQHLAKKFPVLTYGETPEISTDEWQLKIWGLGTTKTFRWADIMAMPQQQFTADFHCVTHWTKLDVKWTGIKITDFMQQVKIDPKAVHVMAHCYGGYTTNLSLEDFLQEDNFLAHTLFDEPLPTDHGGPLRLVVPHLYAWKSAKWLNGFEFLDEEALGFWEVRGYHKRGEPWAEERYTDD
ncbi:MAG: sulfite oxidase-like oxidoreductase [Microcoleaceae cyanobacterium]